MTAREFCQSTLFLIVALASQKYCKRRAAVWFRLCCSRDLGIGGTIRAAKELRIKPTEQLPDPWDLLASCGFANGGEFFRAHELRQVELCYVLIDHHVG